MLMDLVSVAREERRRQKERAEEAKLDELRRRAEQLSSVLWVLMGQTGLAYYAPGFVAPRPAIQLGDLIFTESISRKHGYIGLLVRHDGEIEVLDVPCTSKAALAMDVLSAYEAGVYLNWPGDKVVEWEVIPMGVTTATPCDVAA